MTKEEEKNPLWMPKGSVRSIIVIVLLMVAGYGLIKGLSLPEWYITLLSGAVMYYFGTRA